jgi:enoyl-CoA hydratase/carnithine racemase
MPRALSTPPLRKSAAPAQELLVLPTLRVTKDAEHPVATVALSRPAVRNALNGAALADLARAFTWLDGRLDVSVVVLRGEGKSFCAGVDLSAGAGAEGEGCVQGDGQGPPSLRQRRWRQQLGGRAMRAIRDCEAVTVAAVHGHAIGGGFGLLLACDLRLVEAGTQLFLPEMDLGNPVPWGLTPLLARDVGLPVARELVLLATELEPQRALGLGLVNRVVEGGEAALREAAEAVAYAVAAKGADALALAKAQFRALQHSTFAGDVSEHDADWMLLSKAAGATRSKL